MEIKGKVALVTGGGTGIGRATSLLLAKHGADIAINFSRSSEAAQATANEIRKFGRRAACLCADVSHEDEVKRMVEQVVNDMGRLDILINNAAYTEFIAFERLDELTTEIWDKTMAVNVKGPFYCMRAAAPHMKVAGEGVIVNVSSLAARLARGSSIAYCASKAALDVVTRSMARVLAPKIRVNAVAPGVVKTRWVEGQDAFIRAAQMQTPMRRVATPEDVAQIILSLVAGSDFMTGQIVIVDGGLSA